MSDATIVQPPLPRDWLAMLDAIDARLLEAVGAADLRAGRMPVSASAPASAGLKREWADLAERLRSLQEGAARAQALADDEDLALGVDADALQRRLQGAESLRQRLAEWTARAIG
jgi:hypothetical protein